MHYKYCPKCGNKLTKKPAGDNGKVPYCEKCKKFWFDSFSSCIIILIYNEYDEVVLLKQKHLSSIYATFVSGYISPGESAEECAIREVKEEIGIDIENPQYAGTYWFGLRDQLMHGFIAYAPKCELKLSQEIDEAYWIPAPEAGKKMYPNFPGNAASAIYQIYLNSRNTDK